MLIKKKKEKKRRPNNTRIFFFLSLSDLISAKKKRKEKNDPLVRLRDLKSFLQSAELLAGRDNRYNRTHTKVICPPLAEQEKKNGRKEEKNRFGSI